MYSLDDLKKYTDILGFNTVWQCEKDYLQEFFLKSIFSKTNGKELIFRGGTALSKLYSTGRFSEDLDFVYAGIDKGNMVKKIEEAIRTIETLYHLKYQKKDYKDMIDYDIMINGPLYTEKNEASRQRVSIDINTYEKTALPAQTIIRTPVYSDISPYTIIVKQIEELFMDKLLALSERKRQYARDLYDIWAILKKDYPLNSEKIEVIIGVIGTEKIEYNHIMDRIDNLSELWDDEMKSLVNVKIDFLDVKKEVEMKLKQILNA
ncbi:MAG: nucleotidyl transferase AbiEii/AbiGii toxin family protein [Candidatus Parvarchaeum sp.]